MTIETPENAAIIAHLKRGPRKRELLVAPEASSCNPYWSLGSHPEVVERVWDEIGRSLSKNACQIVCGRPSLVHPMNATVFAVSYGTQYLLRFPPQIAARAKLFGFNTTVNWTYGGTTDLLRTLGPEWVFGQWSPLEQKWLVEAYSPFDA